MAQRLVDEDEPQSPVEEVSMTVNVKGLTAILNSLKSGSKQQVCAMRISPQGLTVSWEDESKTLQSSLYLPSQLFDKYHCPAGVLHSFGMQLNILLDTLNIFASAQQSTLLQLKYPGIHGELVCGMDAAEGGCALVTYARIGTVELPGSRELTEFWQGPESYFITTGNVMKEVIEDLEWPAADISLHMAVQPQQLILSACGVPGNIQVEVPTSEFMGFHVVAPLARPPQQLSGQAGPSRAEVQHSYKYKALRAAFCNVPSTKDTGSLSTKVTVDSQGMLKVTHMVTLQDRPQSLAQRFDQDPGLGGTLATQSEKRAVITFVTVPVVVEDAPEDREQ